MSPAILRVHARFYCLHISRHEPDKKKKKKKKKKNRPKETQRGIARNE
jgi:hypothetical protein